MSKTNSRYDFMKDGLTQDEINGSFYPDPLTLNYSDLKLNSLPTKDILDNTSITKIWKEADNKYGKACWDDVVLTLNGVSHKNFLKPNDALYFPEEEDILNSFNKER